MNWIRSGWLQAFVLFLALLIAAPVFMVLWLAVTPGSGTNSLVQLTQTVLPRYLLTSIALAVIVLVVVVVFGVSCGWFVAAYEFPGRAWIQWALLLPLAIPAFVIAYAYTDFFDVSGPLQEWLRARLGLSIAQFRLPDIRSLPGAGIILGLALYPYVYMLARTAFEERSPSLAEAARSLGVPRRRIWWTVIWPVARPAVAAGCALVLMETLADFGTVSYFAVDTFTAGIYRAWQGLGDKVAAARLALVLITLVGVLVWIERKQRRRMRFYSRGTQRARREPLAGRAALRVTGWCLLPILLGFLLPMLLLVRAWVGAGFPLDPRMGQWVVNTLMLAALATAVVLPLALAGAYAARVSTRLGTRVALAVTCAGYALPGVVLGVGFLSWFGMLDRWIGFALLSGTVLAVVSAYAVRFFAVAFQGFDAGLARISPSMDQSARSLGRGPLQVLHEVHWPLLRPTALSAGLLVFVDALKELPATLVLRPFNFDTLVVMAYHLAADERLGAAAAPALLVALVGMLPVLLLARSSSHRRGTP